MVRSLRVKLDSIKSERLFNNNSRSAVKGYLYTIAEAL